MSSAYRSVSTPNSPAGPDDDDGLLVDTRVSRLHARRARRRKHGRRFFVVVGAVGIVVALVVGVTTFLGVKTAAVAPKIFGGGGSVLGLVGGGTPLKTDANGRVNILVFGTSQDDPAHVDGEGGQGMWLTDSIQLMSIDEKTKTAAMVAIPRDTWVKQPTKCVVGTSSKINAIYECGTGVFDKAQSQIPNYQELDKQGAQALMTTVTQVTGLVPQYFAHINYSVVRQAVDAVGGVDVDVVGDGHDGLYDNNLDPVGCAPNDKSCRMVYYPKDGVYQMDGAHALAFARARGDSGKRYSCMQFGLDGGDFDRQANQQKVMVALKNKAVSAGTLANPSKISSLLDALGDNVTTNLSTDEAKSAIDLARGMGQMTSINLVDPAHPVMTTGSTAGQSIVRPIAGLSDYSKVQAYIAAAIAAATPGATPSATSSAPPTTTGTSGKTSSKGSGSSSAPVTPTTKPTNEPSSSCAGR